MFLWRWYYTFLFGALLTGSADAQSVQLQLGITTIANNSVVDISSIGEGDAGLICTTTLVACCSKVDQRLGEWYHTNGSSVRNNPSGDSLYRDRVDSGNGVLGAVRLNRRNDPLSPVGIYHCVIPDINRVNQKFYVGIYATSANGAQLVDPIPFQLTPDPDALSVSFSLTCTSNGGPISTMEWKKDGMAVSGSNIYPDLTNRETATYTNVLQVSGRETGIYTCDATDGAGTISLSMSITVQAANPPNAVSANQTMTSVLISWSVPTSGGAEVTGYRIYYNSRGMLQNVMVDAAVFQYELMDTLDDMMVYIRSESAQLPSELVNVSVTEQPTEVTTTTMDVATTMESVFVMQPTTVVAPAVTTTTMDVATTMESVIIMQPTTAVTPAVSVAPTAVDVEPTEVVMTTVVSIMTVRSTTIVEITTSESMTSTSSLEETMTSTQIPTVTTSALPEMTAAPPIAIDITISVTPGSSNIAGHSYGLECTANINGSTDQPTITWLDPMNNPVPSEMVNTTGSMSTLTFNPLAASHAGTYTCSVMINSLTETKTAVVSVNNPNVTVEVSGSGATPTAGQNYSLTCSVFGAEGFTPTYRWLKNGSPIASETDSTLYFPSLRLSNAGSYSCEVTVMSSLLSEDIVTSSNMFELTFKIPSPSNVILMASPSGTVVTGSSLSLTCTVDLSSSVDISVNVMAIWSDQVTTTSPFVMVNTTRYTSTVMISLTNIIGNQTYFCMAYVTSESPNLNSSDVTTGELRVVVVGAPSSPMNVIATPGTTSIMLTWDQDGGDVVDSYEIVYTYEVNAYPGSCIRSNNDPITVMVNDGSTRSFTLSDSDETPVEEDSTYTISLTAINSAGRSPTVNVNPNPRTQQAVPSAAPQSVNPVSVNLTNITITWERVDCLQRNGQIVQYRVTYYPTGNSDASTLGFIIGTDESDRVFTAVGLPPQTSYTFDVVAVNTMFQTSPVATLDISTSIPQEVGILLKGRLYGNNDIVTIDNIGEGDSSLLCYTNDSQCCRNAGPVREWYFPNGTTVRVLNDGDDFYRNRGPSVVRLNRRNNAIIPTGVFRCEIPDASGTSQSIYIGLYPEGEGSPSITSLSPNRTSMTLTCTSTGGPPTTVTWRKDDAPINTSIYQQSQRVMNAETATYENILSSDDFVNFVGNFTCSVSNNRGSSDSTLELNGVFITSEVFNVGEEASATCFSDDVASMIEWLHNGMTLESATSTKQLTLTFSQVNDSIHGNSFICRVTRTNLMTAQQTFVPNVIVPPNALIGRIEESGNATVGQTYRLICNATTVAGLTNSPRATWFIRGSEVTTGNGLEITLSSDGSVATLSFNPLKTSHATSDVNMYSCQVSVDSQVLDDSPLVMSIEQVVPVKISTPSVTIHPLSGTLFAGTITPVVLSCNISIDSAVDEPVTVSVTWIRDSTLLVNTNDSRVSISPLSGSQPLFTSTLTLSPLSTEDNATFTCQASATLTAGSSAVTPSDIGSGSTTVPVTVPPAPVVSIVNSSLSSFAGEDFNLTCRVTVMPDNLLAPPTLLWAGPGVGQNGVQQSVENWSILTFSPLRTSHGGVYTCTANLVISVAFVSISGTNMATVTVRIPSPVITITGSPRNMNFFQGLDLSLTCRIVLHPTVNTDVSVNGVWSFNNESLSDSSDGRVTLTSRTDMTPYDLVISFRPLNVTDAGNYTCDARVSPEISDFIVEVNTSSSRDIQVTGFPPQNASINDDGDSSAGSSNYVLTCSVIREEDLSNSSTLAVEWLSPNGSVISSGDNFTVSDAGPTNASRLTSRLSFANMYTSQAGTYTCRSLLTIPGTVNDHQYPVTFTVKVKLPAPVSVTVVPSRDTSLYEGTLFSLNCIITPNMTGVDTDFVVERNFSGPQTSVSDRVTLTNNIQDSTLMFSPLAMNDDGTYVCSTFVNSTTQQPYVTASDATMNNFMINVDPLPPPDVTITPSPSPVAGQSHTLDCLATTQEFIINVPALEWIFLNSNGDSSIVQATQINGTASSNRTLTLNPLRTSHGGCYTCRAVIDIPVANISNRNSHANTTVIVQIPRSEVTVVEGPFLPYNGTVFNLTGLIQLDTNLVNTGVTIEWVWSRSGMVMETQTTTSLTVTLTFEPLATNSSGQYLLNLTVIPTENMNYVLQNNNSSTFYDLFVERLPVPVLFTTITARSSEDDCSEAMTITCTATTVANVFATPTITWLYSGDSVPDSGNPRMDPMTGQLIFDDIISENVGVYTCRASLIIPDAFIEDHYNETTREITTTKPGPVENFKCMGTSSLVLSLSWEEPMETGSGVVGYSVETQKLQNKASSSNEVESVPLVPSYDEVVKELQTNVTQGLEPAIPYNVTVMAVNLAGCGEQQQLFCFTEEGKPPNPKNVTVSRVSSTAILVRWDKLTLVDLKGFATYIITYTVGEASRKRQATTETVTALWNESSKMIDNLPSGQGVSVQVQTSSTGGMSELVETSLPPEPVGPDLGTIVGAIIAVLLLIVLIIIIVVIVIILYKRHRTSKFSPGHHYDVGTVSESRELQQVVSQPASPMNDKEKEALEESSLFKPATPQRSALTTEVLDRMKSVSLTSFRDHVASKHEDRDKGFESEYQSFGTDPVNNHDIAKLPINRAKNRFANIFPYDHSRVILNDVPGEEGSDYINACSLDGYKREGCYIAAQGPLPNTISDFWRMIWERRMPNIVMLTKCLEAGRRKCEQYWADNIGEDYMTPDKKLNITTTSVMPYADFVIRTFSLKSLTDATLDPLSVTQYHFTSWPDHGVPKFATSLISFIRRVQRGHTKDSGRQLLVHCSAGVGRTGTFITLDSMLDRMAAKEADVNVYEFVYKMRQRRVLMVQTLAQYVFIHDALNELITCGQTDIVASALRTKVNFLSKIIPAKGITGFQNQFQLLEQASREPADEDITDAMEPFNQKKNRYMDKIPYNMSRARLRPTGEDGSEYINASFIDGYKQRNAYIATQGPLQDTVNDVWRMLYEFKSRTMVMLCNMNEEGQEAAYPFFPGKEEEPVKYGKMLVTLQSKAAYTDFIVRRFSIQEDKQSSPKNDGFVVTQFHLTEWSPTAVPNTGILIEMLDMITKNQMNTGNRPITVMCNDGVGRTGTFICIHAQLERLKTEGVVDFFQSIKSARIQRAGLVPNVDQYAFCHTALADYIDKFDNYANFKDMI